MSTKMKRTLKLVLLALMCTLLLGISTSASAKTVASIGSKNYSSLQSAIKAVKNGQTIQLKSNVTITETIKMNRNVKFTLNLNKKKITSKNCSALAITKGTVTLKNGTIKSSMGIFVEKKATLNIKSGTYNCYISSCGKLNVSGGTIKGVSNDRGTMTMKGGKIKYGIYCTGKNSSLTITGGTVIQPKDAWGSGAVTVSDNFKKLVISGGSIIGNSPTYPPVMIIRKPSTKAKINEDYITTASDRKVGYAYETEIDGMLDYAFYD